MRFFPEVLARNWQLKLSALAMAVLLWTVPQLETQGSYVLEDVPVEVQLNDPDWALLEDPLPPTVSVTISGSTRTIMALRVDRPSIWVPIDAVSSADTAILLLPPWLRTSVGEDFSVEGLVPNEVRLSFERMDFKPVNLLFRSTGFLPEGLSLARVPEVSPGFVRVSGPASRLGELTVLGLMPIDLSGLRNSASFDLPVDTAGLAGMALSSQRASVEIVLEETLSRSFPEVSIRLPVLDDDPQLQARPATVTLELSGARSLVEDLDLSGIRLTVSQTVGAALVPGEEVRATLSVEGVPEVVQATLNPEWVLLRRPTGL